MIYMEASNAWQTYTMATSNMPSDSLKRAATVLQIEHDLESLDLVEASLCRLQRVHVIAAMQGRLGLDLARYHRPDLIVLDTELPDLSVYEVLQQLRQDERTRNIPVITLGPTASAPRADGLVRAGVYAHLAKPLDVTRLIHMVGALLIRTRSNGGEAVTAVQRA